MRKLLIGILFVPVLLLIMVMWGYRYSLYSLDFSLVLFALLNSAIFTLWLFPFLKKWPSAKNQQPKEEALKRLQEKLQASESRLRRVLDSLFTFTGIFSAEGKLLYSNNINHKITAEEAVNDIGKHYEEFSWLSPLEEEREKLRKAMQAAASGQSARFETHVIGAEGNKTYLDVSLVPLFNEQQESWEIIVSAVDVTDKEEVKGALQLSNERYKALINNFPNGAVLLFDKECRYQMAGGTGLQKFGLTAESLIGKMPTDVVGPELAEEVLFNCRSTLAGESLMFELSMEGRHYRLRTAPILDEKGDVEAALLISQDISHEKETEEKLGFYKFMVDNSHDPVYWLSPEEDFRFTYVNKAACRHFELPADKLLNMSVPDIDPKATLEDCRKSNEAMRQRKHKLIETQHLTGSGELVPVEISASLLSYKGKEFVSGYIKDLREKIKADTELREGEEKYRNLFESSIDPIFMVDVENIHILDVNEAACKLYGYSKEEFLQLRIINISAEPEVTEKAVFEHLNYIPERYHKKKDGTVFPVEVSVSFTFQQGKELIFAVVRDVSERLRASRNLKEEKQRLELALESAGLATWDLDIKTSLSHWSKRFYQMLGYEAEEIQGGRDSWSELVHPDDLSAALDALSLHIKGGSEYYINEHRLKTKAGEWIWTIGTGKVVEWDEDGKPCRMLGVQQDISRLKQAEQALVETRLRMEGIIASAMDAIITINGEQKIVMFNRSAEMLFGYKGEEVMGKALNFLMPERFRQQHSMHVKRFGTTGETSRSMHPAASTIFGLRADGTEFPIEASISQLVINEQKFFTVIMRDITERLAAVQKLKAEKQRLELAMIGGDLGMWDWDVPGGKVVMNRNWAIIMGLDPNELESTMEEILQQVHTEDQAGLKEKMEEYLQNPQGYIMHEYRIRNNKGEWRLIQTNGKVLETDSNGKAVRIAGIHQDITEEKAAAERLRKMELEMLNYKIAEQHKLSAAFIKGQEEERSRLARELHDGIGQQLNVLKMQLSMEESTLKSRKFIDHIINEVVRINNNLMPLVLQDFGLEAAVRQMIEKLKEVTDVNVYYYCDMPGERLGYEVEIAAFRVVQEATSNALKYANATHLSVQLTREHNKVLIMIEDDGKGFDPEGKMKKEKKGFGLLNMQYRVEALGGRIHIESNPGQGCLVNVVFPVVK